MATLKKNMLLRVWLSLLLLAGTTDVALSRPEIIKPGLSYYADDFTTEDNISELGEEKNYEEVFKNYEYYEATYNKQKRPAMFRIYKKGKIILTEHYFYNGEGKLVKKEILKGDEPAEVIHFIPE